MKTKEEIFQAGKEFGRQEALFDFGHIKQHEFIAPTQDEYFSQLSPSKGVEVPTDEDVENWAAAEYGKNYQHSDKEEKAAVASGKHFRNRMLSLLSEKDKNIEEWKENFNTSIKLWEEERKKFQSELEAVKKESGEAILEWKRYADRCKKAQDELKSHADKMANHLQYALRHCDDYLPEPFIQEAKQNLTSYKTNLK